MSSLYIRRVLLKPAEGVSLPSVLMGSVSPKSKHHRIEDYEGKLVLVEAKKYDGELVRDKFGKKIYQRIEDIANMLHDPFPYDELPVLQCEGYSEDSGTNEYLLIFSLPPEASTEPLIPISLLDYFQQRAVWSLTARIRLARRLANAIYAIHKKGWLHKGIRGDNVLFFPGAPGAPRSIEKPRLAGFDFARRDGPWEEEPTEKMVTMAIEPNLYRHPEALRDPTTRFTKLHEYYSFGIVLVEIAKWHSMRFILKRHYAYELKECGEEGMKKVREILLDPDSKENHMADVAFRMGDIYRNVVEVCLTGNFGVQGTGDELLEEFRRRVLEPLAKCCI